MLFKVSLVLVVLIGAFLAYVALQPSHYSISRGIVIQASPDRIFPHINNPQKMHEWNPWIQMDKSAKLSYSGPGEGVGAKTEWRDGKQLGTGSATVIQSIPNQKVVTRLEYFKPHAMTQEAQLVIESQPDGSKVTWSVEGDNAFIMRIFCTLMNMNKTVESTFQKGLEQLKTRVEKNGA